MHTQQREDTNIINKGHTGYAAVSNIYTMLKAAKEKNDFLKTCTINKI